jgi:hypothetical protein
MSEFKFPDESEIQNPSAVNNAEEVEIEVVDDTPEEDRGRPPMKEPPAEVTDDELEQYSEGVKKRIQHFSKGYHEERRAKEAAMREREEAISLAQKVMEDNKRLQSNLGEGQAALIEQAKKVITGEIEDAKRQYKAAYEAGDSEALIVAQEALLAAKIKDDRVNSFKPALQPKETEVQPTYQQQPEVQFDQKARAWQDANPWFGENKKLTAFALAVHQELVEDGVNPTSDEYYQRINAEMRDSFPNAFPSEKKKSNVVASAQRSTAPKKIVLTSTQVAIAKRLNVPLELYAKQVAEQMRKSNG